MSRTTQIREEIVKISEDYNKILRKFGNTDPDARDFLEACENEAEELLEEYKGLTPSGKENNKMDEILKEFAGIIMKSTCDETNGGMDNVRYFIYDEAPII